MGRKLKEDAGCVSDGKNCEELNADKYVSGMLSEESIRPAGKPKEDSPDKYDDSPKLAPHAVEHVNIAVTIKKTAVAFAFMTIVTKLYPPA